MCAQLLKESSKIVTALQAELKIIRNVEMYLCYYKEVLAEMKKARVYTAAECFSRRGMINSPRLQYFTTLLHVFLKCNSARIDIFKICKLLLQKNGLVLDYVVSSERILIVTLGFSTSVFVFSLSVAFLRNQLTMNIDGLL